MSARWGDAFAARRYTARWHRVHDWATRAVVGDLSEPQARNPRVALVRGMLVLDLGDEEEAIRQAVELAELSIEVGPDRERGGRRRVLVRVFTWVIDDEEEVAYDPQWITTGEGQTAMAAAARHNRYVRAYTDAVHAGTASRRLGATAMEVAFWTASPRVHYV